MVSLADVSFDVFCAIFKWTDPLALQAISETTAKFREWSSSPALWKELIRRMQDDGVALRPSGFTDIQSMSCEDMRRSAIRAQKIRMALTIREAIPSSLVIVDCAPGRYRKLDDIPEPGSPAVQPQPETRGRTVRSISDGGDVSGAVRSGSRQPRNVRAAGRYPVIQSTATATLQPQPQPSFRLPPDTSRYQTTQRIRWVIAIAPGWFAVKLGSSMSSGFLQIWYTGAISDGCGDKKREEAPRVVMQYRHDWRMWGAATDFQRKYWYFLLTEDGPGLGNASHGHTMRLLRFSGFSPDRTEALECATAASFPSYGSPITTFFLSITHRRLAILYSSTHTRTIYLFFTPDWDAKECVLVDTGIPETYEKSSFLCVWEEEVQRLRLQYDTLPRLRGRVLAYSFDELMRHAESEPPSSQAFANTRTPPRISAEKKFDINFEPFRGRPRRLKVEGEPPYVPIHELKSAVFCDHDFLSLSPPEGRLELPEPTSVLSFHATYGAGSRDLHPSYVFEQHVAMRIPTQEEIDRAPWDSYFVCSGAKTLFSRRLRIPFITRMAYEQDYMDRNSAERFPVGHSLDLRGHELAALGQGMAAWIEAKDDKPIGTKIENMEFELKVVMFPTHHRNPLVSIDRGEEEMVVSTKGEDNLVVCTVRCPPEVDLATVTGIWLDAVQGQICLGLKWGKFAILRFG